VDEPSSSVQHAPKQPHEGYWARQIASSRSNLARSVLAMPSAVIDPQQLV
jgi:hypothetical protein